MNNINMEKRILEIIEQSTCFGLAHDPEVPECKMCDVQGSCKARMEGAKIPTPTSKTKPTSTTASTKTADKPVKKSTSTTKSTKEKAISKPKPAPKKSTQPAGNFPDFKPMTLDELKNLAKERGVEWRDYGNDQITRMRLIMALKKSY